MRETMFMYKRFLLAAHNDHRMKMCGVVCNCGPNGEPLACAYKERHSGEHSWATLRTFPLDDTAWFVPEGDRRCGVIHRDARATCMKRKGHEGSHATPQGTWIDGPWCIYPAGTEDTQGGQDG